MKHPLEELASTPLSENLNPVERRALNKLVMAIPTYWENPRHAFERIKDDFEVEFTLIECLDTALVAKYDEQTRRYTYRLRRESGEEIKNAMLVVTVCYVGPRHEVIAYVS